MQTEIQDPYRLKLSADVQEMVERALCDIVRDTVDANRERNRQLRGYRYQLEGYSQPNTNQPWPGACQIESTISRELHSTTTFAIWSGARQEPKCSIESVNPDGVDKASKTETYLNLKAQQFKFDEALYNAIYLANEGRFSVVYQYSDQTIHRWFDLVPAVYEENESGDPVLVQEAQVVLRQEPKDFCVKFRTPDPWDFYVYPPEASGPDYEENGCLLCFEKMYLTAEDLTLGVLYEGYSKAAVDEMIAKGPASLQDEDEQDRDDEYDTDGIEVQRVGKTKDANSWQCFQVIGRMPKCLDEDNDPQIPPDLLHVDCLWMICPALQIIFKQAYSPAPQGMRPYTPFHVLEKPNRLLGEGIVSIITPVHEEMTAIERFGINNMNLEASPVMTVAEGWLTRYSKWTIAPGRFMPRQSGDPVGPKPLQWDISAQSLILPWLQTLDAQANRLAATQGVNAGMAGKVRKAAEVHFAEAVQQIKFDGYLSNIQRGIVKVYEKLRLQLIQHMNESGAETDTAYAAGQTVEVDQNTLSETYRFFASAASDSMTPAARLSKMQTVAEIVNAYWMNVPMWAQSGCLPYMWKLNYRLLVLAQERTPEQFLGPEPQMDMMAGGTPPGMPPLGLGIPGMDTMPGMQGGSPSAVQGGAGGPGGAAPMPVVPQPIVPHFAAGEMSGGGMLQSSSLSPRNGSH